MTLWLLVTSLENAGLEDIRCRFNALKGTASPWGSRREDGRTWAKVAVAPGLISLSPGGDHMGLPRSYAVVRRMLGFKLAGTG